MLSCACCVEIPFSQLLLPCSPPECRLEYGPPLCELSAPCSLHSLAHWYMQTLKHALGLSVVAYISVRVIYPGPVLAIGKGCLSYTAVRMLIQLDIGIIAMGQICYAESGVDGSAV